jgi:hypothetical protein
MSLKREFLFGALKNGAMISYANDGGVKIIDHFINREVEL